MSHNVAPWLQGLDEAWELPQGMQIEQSSSPKNSLSRVPRKSLSGLPSSLSNQNSSSRANSQKTRSPLATISNNDSNSFHRKIGASKLPTTRSFSGTSNSSLLQHGTVQQRPKSTSPAKKQETLEWKRRLVRGEVGYGDQTDLFGPSGLENIFAKSREPEANDVKPTGSTSWLNKFAAQPMPSSPPPWPSKEDSNGSNDTNHGTYRAHGMTTLNEQRAPLAIGNSAELNGSFHSNPFDLSNSDHLSDQTNLHELGQHELGRQNADVAEPVGENAAVNRTASGQTELDQEDFSPVFISKHTTLSGQVDYKALDSRKVKQFQDRRVSLRHPSQQDSVSTPLISTSPKGTSNQNQSIPPASTQDDAALAVPDLSLSEDLSTGTPPATSLSRNVQLNRGGYSNYGSFKQRPLSPSQSGAALSNIDGPSGISQFLLSSRKEARQATTPPHLVNSLHQQPDDELRPESSASPLKLFGPHDTFTSNRLLRRMSQLEPDSANASSSIRISTPAPLHRQANLEPAVRKASLNSFGSGDHDGHVFDAEITLTSPSDHHESDSDRSPGSDVPPPGSRAPFRFKLDDSLDEELLPGPKRQVSRRSVSGTNPSRLEPVPERGESLSPAPEDVAGEACETATQHLARSGLGTGKRPPNSPFKVSTPKRRRTLHASEVPGMTVNPTRPLFDRQESASAGRKRKDARKGEDQNIADAAVLAQRKILRPRNPTPSQRRKQQLEAEIREAAEEFAAQEPEKLEAVMEQIESSMTSDSPPSIQQQAQAVANEVAKFTLRIQKASGEHTDRKRSVTTQDFFNEAVMVMRLIREKAGRQSGLGSVTESDQEVNRGSSLAEISEQGAPALRLSRPPSREGGVGWRPRSSEQTDARKLSHLRKFQEKDDTEFIAQSITSLGVPDTEEPQMVVVDEESNIRITGPLPAEAQRQHHDADDGLASHRSNQSKFNSQSTHNSNNTSTGRTIHTNSTRKSDNLGTLAPDAVAHLIGEQVGAMTYDKEKQQWVRVKNSPLKRPHTNFLEPSNISSDDDPFQEISDLPVDERKEEEIRKASTNGKSIADLVDQAGVKLQMLESRISSHETVLARPTTSDSNKSHHTHSSSIPTHYTALYSSQQQQVETRATSWSDEELRKLSSEGKTRKQPLAYAAAQAALAMGRQKGTASLTNQRVQEADMAFQSLRDRGVSGDAATSDRDFLVDEISVDNDTDYESSLKQDSFHEYEASDIEDISPPKLRHNAEDVFLPPASVFRQATRQVSLRRKTLTSKFNPRVDALEQSEVSIIAALPGERMMSVSLSVSRPLSNRQALRNAPEPTSSPSKYDASFMLSDLPDFTVHEEDRERPSERVLAQRLAKHVAAEVNDPYALAVKDLVKTLTDVEEEEPYWDDLKQLDLQGRSLTSLHGLSDFCGQVQEMDCSNNALTHLGGSPSTLRNLAARANNLTALTSWTHLVNLQYLDISGNQLDSLRGLGCLYHLRELRADDNRITSLDGITHLDGLLRLRLRRNAIEYVNLTKSTLHRLQEMDLSENRISSLQDLDLLQSLEKVQLDGNSLHRLPRLHKEMIGMQYLSLQRCRLTELDVSKMPAMRTLLLDDNELGRIEGIEKLQTLDILSLRRQKSSTTASISILDQTVYARTMRLSGCRIPSLELSRAMLGLQHLELASAGLQDLPVDFGLKCPNLQSLNLNFNALKDLRPLLNIQNLERLSVCGNRLERLRKSVATLSKMKGLRSLDLRANPLTLGIYASHASISAEHLSAKDTSVVRRLQRDTYKNAMDEEVMLEEAETARYGNPAGDFEADREYVERLDESMKLRRKVYQLLLANSCLELNTLDGLPFNKTTASRRDATWNRLVELGVVRRSETVVQGEV